MESLRFPAYLLVLLFTTVAQINGKVIKMGMFPEVADYSFFKCRNEMLNMVTKPGGLLQTELDNSTDFKSMWKNNLPCEKSILGGTPEHTVALQSYVEDETFRKTFNKVLKKSQGSSTYQDEFPFKSLFFLLTDAMQLLKNNNCSTVYSGTEDQYNTKIGDEVRFESFFPARQKYSEVTEDASGDEPGTVFNITSCSVINLNNIGCHSELIDLLLFPTEVFTVVSIKHVNNNNDQYQEITLKHLRFQSSSNCSGLVDSVSKRDESQESSSSLMRPGFLNLMASLLMVYFYTLTL